MESHFHFDQHIPTVQYLNAIETYRLFSMFSHNRHTNRSVSKN